MTDASPSPAAPDDSAPDDGYRTQSPDTSREIEQLQILRWRAMSPSEKLAEFEDMCRAAEVLSAMGKQLRRTTRHEH
ncbi:MAG: hypothetical protein ACT4PU_00710 [Planctomycetota bacterium]